MAKRKERDKRRLDDRRTGDRAFWLYGTHAVVAAVANHRRIVRRLVADNDDGLARLADAVAKAGTPRPAPERLDRRALLSLLPPDAVHQGVAARVDALPPLSLDTVAEGAGPATRIVVLDHVTDPRNVGAVLRAAAAFNAAGVVIQDRHGPPETSVLAKAASGALETVPLVRVVNIARTLRALADLGFRAVGLDAAAEPALAKADLRGPLALVLGAEGSGLRRLVAEACDTRARIPIARGVDSLNVATAAAIALYEAARHISNDRPL